MILSKLVARNFSRNPDFYDKNALLQRNVAVKLAGKIKSAIQGNTPPSKIFELGCGTGFLTMELLRDYQDNSEYTITDISEAMLDFCRKKVEDSYWLRPLSVRFGRYDISSQNLIGNNDLIVSGLTFQWVSDLKSAIEKIYKNLTDGGFLAFSTLTKSTFRDFKKSFEEFQTPYPGPNLPAFEDIKKICGIFSRAGFDMEVRRESYPSTISFLRRLQENGAGNATGKAISPGRLRKIIKHHTENSHIKNGLITVEYHIVYGICRK